MITEQEARRRVTRGAKMLDENCPGWWEQIDTDALDLTDDTQCVLGQVYGDYEPAIEQLAPVTSDYVNDRAVIDLEMPIPAVWGFMSDDLDDDTHDVALLKTAWTDAIRLRRDGVFLSTLRQTLLVPARRSIPGEV